MRLSRGARFFLLPASLLFLGACSSNRSPGNDARGGSSAATFADELSLTGYSIRDNGGHTEIEFRWKALHRPSADYYVFVHMLDAHGGIAFQGDHPLKNGAGAPTSAWMAGDSVVDRFFAAPPPGHSSGTYMLRIGVFIPSPMKVLQLTEATLPRPADDWKNQAVVIANVECK